MSIKALNWAWDQRGMKPATKFVLINLAERHNKDDGQCDPSQARLAEDCLMSRATVNRHLATLEEMGLIKRVRRADRATHRQRSTYYILAFDPRFSGGDGGAETGPDGGPDGGAEGAKPCLKMRHGAVSQKQPKPCLKNGQSRVSTVRHKPEGNPKRTGAGARARAFFTADERMAAQEVAAFVEAGGEVVDIEADDLRVGEVAPMLRSGVLIVGALPKRVAACLASEGHLPSETLERIGLTEARDV